MGFRYIGTKTRIIDEILLKISEVAVPGAHVADLMCGTGSVSAALRKRGYRVTANDVMTFCYHHARAQLLLTRPPTFENAYGFIDRFFRNDQNELFPLSPYQRILKALNHVPPKKGYFWREFSPCGAPQNTEKPRNYFSTENTCKIDAIRFWIRELHETNQINDLEHSLLIHDLIMASNDVANIAGTYGHYLSKLMGRGRDPLELRGSRILIMDDAGRHRVLHGFAEDVADQISCDLCYIDPPYMKRQYAANYHILETLAREDEPEAVGVSGLRPWREQYSDFCTKTRIRDSFRKIFENMKCPRYLISYSEEGLLSLEQLKELFGEFGKIRISTLSNKRFKSSKRSQKPCLTEYLIHLEIH